MINKVWTPTPEERKELDEQKRRMDKWLTHKKVKRLKRSLIK